MVRGRTALHTAAGWGCPGSVSLLLQHGADPQALFQVSTVLHSTEAHMSVPIHRCWCGAEQAHLPQSCHFTCYIQSTYGLITAYFSRCVSAIVMIVASCCGLAIHHACRYFPTGFLHTQATSPNHCTCAACKLHRCNMAKVCHTG